MSYCGDCKYFLNNTMLDRMYCTKLVKRVSARQEACEYFQLPGYPEINNPYFRSLRKNLCRKLLKKISDAFPEARHDSIVFLAYEEIDSERYYNTVFAFEVVNRILAKTGYKSDMHVEPGTFNVVLILSIRKP